MLSQTRSNWPRSTEIQSPHQTTSPDLILSRYGSKPQASPWPPDCALCFGLLWKTWILGPHPEVWDLEFENLQCGLALRCEIAGLRGFAVEKLGSESLGVGERTETAC